MDNLPKLAVRSPLPQLNMNEAETRAELIDPALKAAGWGIVEGSRVRRETIAPGRLLGSGKRASSEYADYVLEYKKRKARRHRSQKTRRSRLFFLKQEASREKI